MSLLKASATVGFFTILSRIAGFARDILILKFLGASALYDAFIVAFKLPNFFRRVSAEGAFSASFVPILAATFKENGQETALQLTRHVLTLMLIFLSAFVILVEIFTPYVVQAVAPGFAKTPERLEWAISFTRIVFPYILFISLTSLLSGLLNCLGYFSQAAAAPIFLNFCMMLGLVLLSPFLATQGHGLSWGVFFAGVIQFVFLWYSLRGFGIRIGLQRPPYLLPSGQLGEQTEPPPSESSAFYREKIKHIFCKMVPGIIGASVFQINLMVDLTIGSLLPVGALTYVYTADRLTQLPLSVIGIAISTAILPSLSQTFQQKSKIEMSQQLDQALLYAFMLVMPAAVALHFFSLPIMKILFFRGAFTYSNTVATANTLEAFAIGLPAFVAVKVLSVGFFAQQNTKTPMIIAGICVLMNIGLNLLFMEPLKHVGIALAISLSSWLNVLLLAYQLNKRDLPLFSPRNGSMCMRVLMASCIMVLPFLIFKPVLFQWMMEKKGLVPGVVLMLTISFAVVIYGVAAHILKLVKLNAIWKIIVRSKG